MKIRCRASQRLHIHTISSRPRYFGRGKFSRQTPLSLQGEGNSTEKRTDHKFMGSFPHPSLFSIKWRDEPRTQRIAFRWASQTVYCDSLLQVKQIYPWNLLNIIKEANFRFYLFVHDIFLLVRWTQAFCLQSREVRKLGTYFHSTRSTFYSRYAEKRVLLKGLEWSKGFRWVWNAHLRNHPEKDFTKLNALGPQRTLWPLPKRSVEG